MLQVNGLNTAQIYSKPQMNTTFKANPVVKIKTLKRATIASAVAKSSQNKALKPLLSFIASVIADLSIFTNKKRAVQKIEKNFADLLNDMPRVQKIFKDVFLRENLTEKEAIEMLNRYKEIEKIRVSGNKEKYARALFNEAKNNYGFANNKLIFMFFPARDYRLCGKNILISKNNMGIIWLNSIRAPEDFANTIHHELRHLKQSWLGINYNPKQYVKSLQESVKAKMGGKIIDEQDILNRYTVENVLSLFNQAKPDKNLIPKGYEDFAQKIARNLYNPKYNEYGKEYFEEFLEQDARFAGESVAKLFGLM